MGIILQYYPVFKSTRKILQMYKELYSALPFFSWRSLKPSTLNFVNK